MFDENEHGYDAELDGFEVEPPAVTDVLASDDVPEPHGVVVRYEYASDMLGDEAFEGREHDLFSWFTLLARDAATGRLALLFESECA